MGDQTSIGASHAAHKDKAKIARCVGCEKEFTVSLKYRGKNPKCGECLRKKKLFKPTHRGQKESPLMAKAHEQVFKNAQKIDPGLARHLKAARNPDRQPDRPMPDCCEICEKKQSILFWKSDPAARVYGSYHFQWYCRRCYREEQSDAGVYSSDDGDYYSDESDDEQDFLLYMDHQRDPDDDYREVMKAHILGEVDYRDVDYQWFFDDPRYGDQELYESCKRELRR